MAHHADTGDDHGSDRAGAPDTGEQAHERLDNDLIWIGGAR